MGSAIVPRLLCTWALVAVGCPGDPDPVTEVVVRIDAQPCTRVRARWVQVRVIDHEGALALDTEEELAPLGRVAFPFEVPVVPRGGDSSRRFWVEAVILDEDRATLSTVRVGGHYLSDQIAEIPACFTDGCAGVDCGPCTPVTEDGGAIAACETCESGAGTRACVPAAGDPVPYEGTASPCPTIASTCGDAGVPDGGGVDAGGVDAGPARDAGSDAGPIDAGDPCARPEDCDNNMDDDCDGRTDCFDDGCGGDPYCQQRQCNPGFPQFRWCSGVCENTNQPANCGGCGIVCTRTACRTDIGDGRARCGCDDASDCPAMANCNLTYRACGCGPMQCGPNASCTPGGGFPAFCDFNVD
jgi:hypothetical protein